MDDEQKNRMMIRQMGAKHKIHHLIDFDPTRAVAAIRSLLHDGRHDDELDQGKRWIS
jgi:CRISPR/Cas system-associated protein Csm6